MESKKVDKSVQTCISENKKVDKAVQTYISEDTSENLSNIKVKDRIQHWERQISIQRNMQDLTQQRDDKSDSIPATSNQKNANSNDSSEFINNKIFKKKTGTTDVGKEYEHIYIANLLLKLSADDSVEDYLLSSNDPNFHPFDDVVVRIKYHHGQVKIYALQLKHRENKSLTIDSLQKGHLNKYLYSDKTDKTASQKDIKTVIFTNMSFKVKDGVEIEASSDVKVVVSKATSDPLLTTKNQFQCHQLKVKNSHKATKECITFFNNFFLYTNETDAPRLHKVTLKKFQEMFHCEEHCFEFYLKFIKDWNMIDKEKEKLNKSWINRVIAICVLGSSIKPLSFSEGTISRNKNTFRKCISNFTLTTFKRNSYDTVKTIWSDALTGIRREEVYQTKNKYQLPEENDRSKENSKILWLLGKCPLVVNDSEAVQSIINLCKEEHFIVLDPTFSKSLSSKFQTLADLEENPEVYERVLNNFTCSLQGKNEISLINLVESEEEVLNVTTDELVQMMDKPLIISKNKETLPPCHTERKLSRIVIDISFLKTVNKETLVVISGVKNLRTFRQQLHNVKMINVKYMKYYFKSNNDGKIVYVSRDQLSQEDFENMATDSKKPQCHHFRYLTLEYLEWMRSTDGVNDLRKYHLTLEDYSIEESELFSDFHFNVNIICADPGMGKSTLMKSLRNNSSATSWTILIYANSHASYFQKKETDVEKFLEYILDKEDTNNSFDKNILQTLNKKRRIYLIWDGLDEVSNRNLETVLSIVEGISKKGLKQWVTSRNNLKEKLELRFNVFSRRMKQFDEEEQDNYIKTRLDIDDENILTKIKENIHLAPYNDILGIPLQIYMLTELFLQDKSNKYYNLLNDTFSIADLYHHFVEGKFRIYFEDKEKNDINNETIRERIERDKEKMTQNYKHIAVCKFIDAEKFPNLQLDCTKLLSEFRKDPVGFIIEATKQSPEFVHNSLGEYFAALFIFDNLEKFGQIQDLIFDDRFNNIRLFLDMMLSENCKAHIAVLYKNFQLLQTCTQEDLEKKNKAGHNALELACTWGKKYPVLATEKTSDTYSISDDTDVLQQFENLKILKFLSQKCTITTENFVFCHNNLIILFPFLILLCKHKIDVGAINSEYIPTILYYALLFDYSEAFAVINDIPVVKNSSGKSLLDLAIEWKSVSSLKNIAMNPYYVNAFKSNTKLLYQMCNSEFETIFQSLIKNGVDINGRDVNDKALLHYACEQKDYETAKFLINNEADVNISDTNDKSAMHYACQSDAYEIVKLLIENGAKLDPVHKCNYKMPIHYASDEKNYKVVRLLIENGAQIDVTDKNGRMPVHKACIDNRYDIVKLLIENGTRLNVADNKGKTPIHYVCSSELVSYHIIELLIENKANPNVTDEDGKMPLHHACSCGNYQLVQYLMTKGAELEVADNYGKVPLHYACFKGDLGVVNLLLDKKVRVDVADNHGKKPIDYAPPHIKQKLNAAGH